MPAWGRAQETDTSLADEPPAAEAPAAEAPVEAAAPAETPPAPIAAVASPPEPAPSLADLVDRGSERFARRDWLGAHEAFARAIPLADADPPTRAALRYNVAVCLERAGAVDRAAAAWLAYRDDPAVPTADRPEADAAIEALRAHAATLEVTTSAPAEIYRGEVLLGPVPGAIRVVAGEAIELDIRADGYAHAYRTVTLQAGEVSRIEVTLVAESAALEEARGRIARGEALFSADQYDAALAEFEAAYALLEGGGDMYLALYNVALCHQRLGRVDLAVRYYRQYLEAAPTSEPGRAEVEGTLRTLVDLLATLVLETNVEADVWVDGRLIGQAPGSVLVAGGLHDVELRAPGVETARFPLQLAAGQRVERRIELAVLDEGGGMGPEPFIATAIVTGIALMAGAVLGGTALQLSSDAVARGPGGNTEDDARLVEGVAIGADVSFAVAGAAGIAAIVLGVATDWDGGQARSLRDVPTAMILPSLGPTHLGATVVGAF